MLDATGNFPKRNAASSRTPARPTGARRRRRIHRSACRRASERIPAGIGGAARLADRLHRFGRGGDRSSRQGGDLRRRTLYDPGAVGGRRRSVQPRASDRDAAVEMARGRAPPRHAGRLRSVADDGRRSPPLRRGVQGRRGRAGRACRESARCGVDGSPAAAGRSRVAAPGGARRRRCVGEARPPAGRSRREAGRRGRAHPGRTRSPGRSTSAAPILPTIRRRLPSRSFARAASRPCSSTAGSSPTPSGRISPISPTSTSSTGSARR